MGMMNRQSKGVAGYNALIRTVSCTFDSSARMPSTMRLTLRLYEGDEYEY